MASFWQTWQEAQRRQTPEGLTVEPWKPFTPVGVDGKLFSQLNLPPFSFQTPVWLGASYITVEFSATLPFDFSLRFPLTKPAGVNFCLALRWVNGDLLSSTYTVVRRKLWQNVGEDLNYPLYAGEKINSACVFEIWSVQGASDTLLLESYGLITSLLYDRLICCDETAPDEAAMVQRCELFALLPANIPIVFSLCVPSVPYPPPVVETFDIIDEHDTPMKDQIGNNLVWRDP